MENNHRYVALEITSKIVRLVVGFVLDGTVHVLHALESRISGVSNGQIVDETNVSTAIRGLVNEAQRVIDIKIEEVVLCLPPVGMCFVSKEASTTIISPENEIAQIDINNAIIQLRKTKFSDGYEIVDIIPYQYILDTKEISIRPPLGKYSVSLLVKAMIYAMKSHIVEGYRATLARANLKIRHCVVAPYASALYLQSVESIPSTYYLLNVGAKIATLSLVSSREIITQNECFKFGGDDLLEAVINGFSCDSQTASELIENYGLDSSPQFKVKIFNDFQLNDMKAILENVINESLVKKIKRVLAMWSTERYPIIIAGGLSKLKGLDDYLRNALGFDVVNYRIVTIGARNKAYLNCLGVIKYCDIHLVDGEMDVMQNTISRVETEEKTQKRVEFNFNDEL